MTEPRRPSWWRRQVEPRPGSALRSVAIPGTLRRLGAAVVLLWVPPLALFVYLVVTIVYAVIVVVLVPFLPAFVLGLRTARRLSL